MTDFTNIKMKNYLNKFHTVHENINFNPQNYIHSTNFVKIPICFNLRYMYDDQSTADLLLTLIISFIYNVTFLLHIFLK